MTIPLISDENISWRLKKLLPEWNILPSNEIKIGARQSDLAIWKFAKANSYTILTFDEDFSELQNIHSFPPKIIWLRTGNITTAEIALLLIQFEQQIIKFLNDDNSGILEIYLK
jgi:predicted nuclease of predicted toxin-antitoxin system